jgi:hypothetical protein
MLDMGLRTQSVAIHSLNLDKRKIVSIQAPGTTGTAVAV